MTRPPLYEHAWVDVVRPQHVPGMLIDLRDRLRGMVVPESTLRRVR